MASTDRDTAWQWLTLALLVAAGAYARLAGLGEQYFSPDDVLHISLAATGSFGETLALASREVVHPPGLFLILHGMLQIADGDLYLRSVSLLPGLAGIPLAYLLGRRAFGREAGLFLAFATTFSYAHIHLSQVVRQYALVLLLLNGALLCLVELEARRRGRTAWLYGALMTGAVLLHHSSIIPAVWIGVVFTASQHRSWREAGVLRAWLGAQSVVVAACLADYVLLIQPLLDSAFRSDAISGWLRSGFPGGEPGGWVRSVQALALYLTSPFSAVAALSLIGIFSLGLLALLRGGQTRWVLIILGSLATNVGLAGLDLYPFSGSRHCVYLLPLLLFAGAAAVQQGAQALHRRWARRDPRAVPTAAGMLVLMGCGVATLHLREHGHYREEFSVAEFPITRGDYEQSLENFERLVAPGDVVISDDQVARYAFHEASISERERLAPGLGRILLRGRKVYYHDAPRLVISSVAELRSLIEGVRVRERLAPVDRVWLFTLGYRNSLIYTLAFAAAHDTIPRQLDPDEAREELRDFARLQRSIRRTANQVIDVGDREGGSILYSVPWSVLDRAVPHPRAAPDPGGA